MLRVSACLVAIGLVAAPALAGVEVTLVGGYRTGDASFLVAADSPGVFCFAFPCFVEPATAEDAESYGLVVDVPVAERLMFELLVNRQDSELKLPQGRGFPLFFAGHGPAVDLEVSTAQIGLRRDWLRSTRVPFAAFGVGATRLETVALPFEILPPPQTLSPVDEEALSASLAGGVRLAADQRVGARVEARAYWTDLPALLGGSTWQVELSTGLALGW